MGVTTLSNLIDPEVLADMVSATLPKKIKFAPIARVDSTLAGQPGSSIKVPKYLYIGDAEDVAEGVAMGTVTLTAKSDSVTIKKAGKAVEITDESLLSAYGDPMGQATRQLAMSIAAKVDNDAYDALTTAPLVYDGTAAKIGYNAIVDANSKFDDEVDDGLKKILFINPAQEATLQKDADFMSRDKYPLDVVMNGTIGSIAGAQVVKSKKVKKVEYEKDNASGTVTLTESNIAEYQSKTLESLVVGDKVKAVSTPYYACPIVVVDSRDPNEDPEADDVAVEEAALTIYMKRDVQLEADRDILKKTVVASADEHYVVALSNESKVVLAKFGV